ncbi:DUF839 domain-containing protein [Rhodoferax sp. 4810]|uniref:DUF839 domain-containing protein n=1 Tax=Thiospirillum jenense TaxID=1653858 RepID=A0A839HCB8_9GAMM|nr:alkaline phosphatase PhoX [Thiospirillum jenense]MBB1072970.1 DUF839 domain-containing protein [Rhodoferax jenense]MBB1124918.1 DUF839 domain-containing protein [Thiospirillum jenense]
MFSNKSVLATGLLFNAIITLPAAAGTIEFASAPIPVTDAEKRSILTSDYAMIDGNRVAINYQVLLRAGATTAADPNGGVFGLLYTSNGNPLVAEDGSYYISNDNDFTSILRGTDNKLYSVSHFESRPGAMYLTEINQDATSGVLTAVRTRSLDFAAVRGGWVHCAGSVTPWGTHLGSEEYEPDAKQWRDNTITEYNAAMASYFNAAPSAAATVVNPYDYGYPVEIKVDDFNHATVTKHYSMGRIALELGYVMPDNKTVYLSDDGTNVGLFRFVAKTAGDLSNGTLWAAQWNQINSSGAGTAKLNWVNLGYANDEQVKEWIAAYRFADIFDETTPVLDANGVDTGACPVGYTSINAGHEDGSHQCLKLRDVNQDGAIGSEDERIASRLETRRWAAMEGATTEFRKMEGITFNSQANKLYIAISEVDRGMLNFGRVGKTGRYDKYDLGGHNHITLTNGNVCGAVYALDIDGSYTARSMSGLVMGIPLTKNYGAANDSANFDGNNECDLNSIANPDNLTYMPGYDTLIIGEDSGTGHQNDMVWAYQLSSGRLTRIQTTPYGSETTSPYFYPNVNGFAYLMSVIQHPYGESDADKLEDATAARGYTGYFVFPAMTR